MQFVVDVAKGEMNLKCLQRSSGTTPVQKRALPLGLEERYGVTLKFECVGRCTERDYFAGCAGINNTLS